LVGGEGSWWASAQVREWGAKKFSNTGEPGKRGFRVVRKKAQAVVASSNKK